METKQKLRSKASEVHREKEANTEPEREPEQESEIDKTTRLPLAWRLREGRGFVCFIITIPSMLREQYLHSGARCYAHRKLG